MSDVRSGKIQCIVVKDLSRFGRNYVEAGYYIETIFPRLGIRFIAVTDDFDNTRKSDMDDLKIPVKNMVNALYAKDISRKVATSARLRQQRGELMKTSTPPFGYRYDENKDTLVVDEDSPVRCVQKDDALRGPGRRRSHVLLLSSKVRVQVKLSE